MADPHVQLARAVLPDDVGVATLRSHRPRWEATLPLTTATGAMETSPPTSTGTTARVLSSVILPRCACGAVLGRCRRLISGAQCGHSEPAELLLLRPAVAVAQTPSTISAGSQHSASSSASRGSVAPPERGWSGARSGDGGALRLSDSLRWRCPRRVGAHHRRTAQSDERRRGALRHRLGAKRADGQRLRQSSC